MSSQRSTPATALVAAGVTVVAWASAFVAIRWVGRTFEPGPLALGRLLVGTLALGALVAARRSWVRPTRREWLLLGVYGVAWFGVYNVALNAAEQRLDAGTTALLVNVGPILIAVLAGALLGEGFPRWLFVGMAVAFCGVVLIGLGTAGSSGASGAGSGSSSGLGRTGELIGALLCLVAAVGYAFGVVAQKPTLRRLPALQVTWLGCLIGMIVTLPYASGLAAQSTTAPLGSLVGLVYLGLVPTSVAFSTWSYALARMDAGRLGVTTYIVPPLTVLGAWVLLGEVPALLALAGGAVSLVGVALSRRRDRTPTPASASMSASTSSPTATPAEAPPEPDAVRQ